jgi:hypothetical protein
MHSEEGRDIFEKILEEFLSLSNTTKNNSTIKRANDFRNKFLIAELEYKYYTTTKVLNLYNKTYSNEVLFVLIDIGWDFDKLLPYGPQIDVITKACNGLKNQIKIKKVNYSNKYKAKEKENSKGISLSKQAMYLQSNLDLGYFLDIRVCSAENWLNLLAFSEEKEKYLDNINK